MLCQTLQADREHQSEQLLPRSFYVFRAYKKMAKTDFSKIQILLVNKWII